MYGMNATRDSESLYTSDGRFFGRHMDFEAKALTIFTNKDWWSYQGLVHLPNSSLCIGQCLGGVLFNGYIDDLTLWNRTYAFADWEVLANVYLDRGINGIVVPRGLFFQSQFFSNLNTTTFSCSWEAQPCALTES